MGYGRARYFFSVEIRLDSTGAERVVGSVFPL